jgi:hypothetical protein
VLEKAGIATDKDKAYYNISTSGTIKSEIKALKMRLINIWNIESSSVSPKYFEYYGQVYYGNAYASFGAEGV